MNRLAALSAAIVLFASLQLSAQDQKDGDPNLEKDLKNHYDLLPKAEQEKFKKDFDINNLRKSVVEIADKHGAIEFTSNMGLEKYARIDRLKANWILQTDPLNRMGMIQISRKIKKDGIASLSDDEKKFVRKYSRFFMP